MKKTAIGVIGIGMAFSAAVWADGEAASAINRLGWALLADTRGTPANVLISPYSIQSALAMAYAGASGQTRDEMRTALFYPEGEAALHRSFSALRAELLQLADETARSGAADPGDRKQRGSIELAVAHRLFGQRGYPFRSEFLELMESVYEAPFETCDFKSNPEGERVKINGWVADRTRSRIQDLIPAGGILADTRLVLVNALYMKAPWMEPFDERNTRPLPFWVGGHEQVPVPTMVRTAQYRVKKGQGYTAVSIPFTGGGLHLVAIVPDDPSGLSAVEASLTVDDFSSAADAPFAEAVLFLPKLKIESPSIPLKPALVELGMRSAFDVPAGSANFDRIAPRRPDDYLFIDQVYHKTFFEMDERGAEAAAASAVVMVRATAAPIPKPKPIEIRVDRPFVFAVQHFPSRAFLFLGRISDPR
ncbi:MAG: serpin family protein [Kiritimatiellae bacterium]|nr:serpin family protein [Kiritimatiellia bacterium]MDW8458084.1 serpin family protein [Verrucomicrobiota bacterium]